MVAVDVSARTLESVGRRLRLDRMTEAQRSRLQLFQSSLTYRDERLRGLDAAVLMEVIEHLDLPRLDALERCVFGDARPGTVIITTPNVEYNGRFETLPAGARRHRDHRFEWTRAEFRDWAERSRWRTGTGSSSCRWGRTTPRSARPPSWRYSRARGTTPWNPRRARAE